MLIFDATSRAKRCLWKSSNVESIRYTKEVGILNVVTTSCHKYSFVNVETVIPTYLPFRRCDPAPEPEPIKMVGSQKDYKSINYGDGYDKMTYTFNREISADEFIQWCKDNTNRRMNEKQSYPFESYVEIRGSGKTWEHKIILCYTD